MSQMGILAKIGAVAAVILFGAGAWILMSSGNKEPWNQEGDLDKFVDECFADLSRRGALEAGNTTAQLKAACKCFGNEFHPLLKGKSHEEAAAFSKQPDTLMRFRSITKKCGYQVGLDGIDEWWN